MSHEATIEDVFREEGRAELVDGRIVRFPPMGFLSARLVGRLTRRLDDYAETVGRGHAYTSTMMFSVPHCASGRQSCSPSASYYDGPLPEDLMRFIEGPPTLAVEIRDGESGREAEDKRIAKREDYLKPGTLVVWDVDPVDECIRVYRSFEPESLYRRGQEAEAEPAVPGWRVDVEWLFGK